MSAPAIRVSGLSKKYRIGERTRYRSLRESLQNAITAPFRRAGRAVETIWALRDVSFEVVPGEVVGVIGRNGAGKSTLLKILSRITEPTEGRVELRGRVGSLLEVGTGFHLELTGRENIFLNGAILGMRRSEIAAKFDEIVGFAEVGRFIDTPVKHFSTGMYLRLAFAVAAHLEPEILLVDEVLAVGDQEFQAKCLAKMENEANRGRTVVFVSHNLPVVQSLCSRLILLAGGQVAAVGEPGEIVSKYLSSGHVSHLLFDVPVDLRDAHRWGGSGEARVARVTMFDPRAAQPKGAPFRGGDLGFRLELGGEVSAVKAVGVQITDHSARKLINVNTLEKGHRLDLRALAIVDVVIRNVALRPGTYKVGFWLGAAETRHIDVVVDHCVLEVLPPVGVTWLSAHDGVFRCEFSVNVRTAG